MRSLVLVLFTVSCLEASISIAQSGPAAHGIATAAATLVSTPTVGHMMAVAFNVIDGTSSTLTVADNQGNTYTQRACTSTPVVDSACWYTASVGTSVGTFIITGTCAACPNTVEIIPFELAGQSSIVPVTSCSTLTDLNNGTNTQSCSMTTAGDIMFLVDMFNKAPGNTNPSYAASGDTLGVTDVNFSSAGGCSNCSAATASLQSGGRAGNYSPGITATGTGGLGTFPAKLVSIALCASSCAVGTYVAQPKSHWP